MTQRPTKPSVRTKRQFLVNVVTPAVVVTLTLAGCSWVPDWANPMTAYDSVFSNDPPPPQPATAEDKQLATQQSGGTFPSVGSVPDKAPQTSSAAERRQVVKGLVADKKNARYTDSTSAQQVASAPPPPVITAPTTTSVPVTSSSTAVATATPVQPLQPARAASRILSVPSIVQGGPQPIAPPQPGAPYPQILLPSTARQPSTVVSVPPTPQPVVPSTIPQVAPLTPSVTVPPIQSTLQQVAMAQPSLAPSLALPGQYTTVEQVFAARLAQSGATVTNAPTHLGFQLASQPNNSLPLLAQSASSGAAMVQPAVLINTALPAARPTGFAGASQPMVVMFPHGSAQITSRERAKVSDIAKRYRASGGGYIRVVGHASSRTKNLPVDKHKLVNFWISMDRAQAVARALMSAGVAPNAIVIEARSDDEPRNFESMPAAEAQNRRTEVFLEF